MNFVAQFRVVQRLIMVCTVLWIIVVLYKMQIVIKLLQMFWPPETPVYFAFDTNDSQLPVKVREILGTEELQPAVANVLYQVSC